MRAAAATLPDDNGVEAEGAIVVEDVRSCTWPQRHVVTLSGTRRSHIGHVQIEGGVVLTF